MVHRCLAVLVFVLATAAVTAGRAVASTLVVNTTGDGITLGKQACSLRAAIAAVDSPGSQSGGCAPAAFGANRIVLGADDYRLTESGVGELTIAPTVRNLTIEGAGEGLTNIDASSLQDRALLIASGASVTIADLTISGGHAPTGLPAAVPMAGTNGAGEAGASGGAIVNNGTLTVLDAAIRDSVAGAGGDGGAAGGPADPAVIGGAGGPGGQGGGIFNTGILTLTGATISGNQAGSGGPGGSGGEDNLSNPSGAGGQGGQGGQGGGIFSTGTVTITDSTINGNAAGGAGAGGSGGPAGTHAGALGGAGAPGGTGADGGGIYDAAGPLSITNSTVASNAAGAGGSGGGGGPGQSGNPGGASGNGGDGGTGGAIVASATATAMLLNVTLAGNQGGGGGGAGGAGATAGKDGSTGGVIGEAGATLTVQNSLLDLNAGNCGAGSVTDGGHNLSFGDASCPGGFITGDPHLGALQDNGGPSATIGLQPGSAAIDQIPATGAACPATDQRGVARPSGTKCDIGAYEVAPPAVVTGPVVAITSHGAVVKATVTPNSGDASVVFRYGKPGHQQLVTTARHVGGVTPIMVTARLRGLKAGAVYRYQVVATSTDGRATGAQRSFRVTPGPVISGLHVAVAPGAATVSYRDSRRATTTLVVESCASHACVSVRTLTHRDVAGRNRVRIRGLRPGVYTLAATAQVRAVAGSTVAVRFTLRA